MTGSNCRPHACRARALPTELIGRIQDFLSAFKPIVELAHPDNHLPTLTPSLPTPSKGLHR